MIKHDPATNRYVLDLKIAGPNSRETAIEILTWLCEIGHGDKTLDSTISENKIPLAEVLRELKSSPNLTMSYLLNLRFSKDEEAIYAMMRWFK